MTLQAYAASYEAARAAVQGGADELLLSGAMSEEELTRCLRYAMIYGLDTVLDYTRACHEAEALRRGALLGALYVKGLSAVAVADIGMLRMARLGAPDCDIHWHLPCMTHADLRWAKEQGLSRAVLSPYLSLDELLELARHAGLPLQVTGFAPLCPGGDTNRCLLGGLRSDVDCGFGCRRAFGYDEKPDETLLLTRDFCLLGQMHKLRGIACLLLRTPDDRPEAVGAFTRTVTKGIAAGWPDIHDLNDLLRRLGRPAATEAPYTGRESIFAEGVFRDTPDEAFWQKEHSDQQNQLARADVPIRFYALLERGRPSRLAVDDGQDHTLYIQGPVPSEGALTPVQEAEINTQWYKVTGPYVCAEARTRIEPGLRLEQSELAVMRRQAVEELDKARSTAPERRESKLVPAQPYLPRADSPVINVRVEQLSQITPALLALMPERIYLPLAEAAENPELVRRIVDRELVPVAVLPEYMRERDVRDVVERLILLHGCGVREALIRTPGQIPLAQRCGYSLRADWASADTHALREAKALRLQSVTLAPWLSFSDIRSMSHVLDTELIGYGRLLLLQSRECLIKPKSGLCACENHNELTDTAGGHMPMLAGEHHSTRLFADKKLWIRHKRSHWRHIGLWGVRLDFTTENPRECVAVTRAYKEKTEYKPQVFTTGYYME